MKRGRIELVIGPMFSGKTTEMFLRVQRHVHAGCNPLIIRFAGDTRYDEAKGRSGLATSHDHTSMVAVSIASNGLNMDIPGLANATVVGIDEGQFFENLTWFCEQLAEQGKIVIVAALDSDYLRKPFTQTIQLIPKTERVDKLSGICVGCQGEASFSKRISSTPGKEDQVIDVGGSDKYVCVCRTCFETTIPQQALDRHKQSIDIILEMRK